MNTKISLPILRPELLQDDASQCAAGTVKRSRIVVRLQLITVAWMLVECSVALISAWRANSAALLAFGSDSTVELLSAVVVLMQFAPWFKIKTDRAAKIAGVLLFVLAGIIALTSADALWWHVQADTSSTGIAITIGALLIMPTLSRAKRRNAEITGNRALAADAVQSGTCAYLAAITLLGLILNAAFQLHWVDSVAALFAVPILCIEGRRALREEQCGCC